MSKASAERARIRAAWPAEYDDGARCGLTGQAEGPREPGGYPKTFHTWELERRNAWFAGFNAGFRDRRRLKQEGADG